MAAERLMIASTYRQVELGQETEKLPSHLTLIPWFTLEEARWSAFDAYIRDEIMVANPSGPFPHAWVGGRDDFTRDKGELVAVTRARVFAMDGLFVYAALRQLVRDKASQAPDETYGGMSWSSHISDADDVVLKEGEELRLDNVTVFQSLPNHMKAVKAVYRWGKYVVEKAS